MTTRTFLCKGYDLHFAGLVDIVGLWETPESPPAGWRVKEHRGPWRLFETTFRGRDWLVSVYRKRINFSTRVLSEARDSDAIEREIFAITTDAEEAATGILDWMTDSKGSVPRFVYFPIADIWDYDVLPRAFSRLMTACGAMLRQVYSHVPLVGSDTMQGLPNYEWLTDRVTTFSYRLFDPTQPHKQAYVRISRHVIICYGVSHSIFGEIFNLIHLKVLYRLAAAIAATGEKPEEFSVILDPGDISALTDGITGTIMPTELNLVLYETAARVALVAGISAGALVFAAATVQRNVIPLPGALAMLLVAAVWLLASIVLWQQSPRLFQALGVYRHE